MRRPAGGPAPNEAENGAPNATGSEITQLDRRRQESVAETLCV